MPLCGSWDHTGEYDLSPVVSKGHLPVFCHSSSGCHSTTSTALCCHGSPWQSDKVCPRQGSQLWMLLSVPFLGIRSLPGPCQLGKTPLQVQAHCVCFSWPCSSPAFTSILTRSFWMAPSGSFHHLSASTTSWRDLEGNTILFSPDLLSLLSGPILLPSVLSSSFFPVIEQKAFTFMTRNRTGSVCLCSGKRRLFFPATWPGCAWTSRMSAPHPTSWMCWGSCTQ